MRAHNSGRMTSFVTERDAVRWCKILHLTGYDVSEAVRTTLALDISMSKYGYAIYVNILYVVVCGHDEQVTDSTLAMRPSSQSEGAEHSLG
jgi:hypothetical protein